MKTNPQTPKPMKWREAVKFLIRFAEIQDAENLRPGDRLNLMDDLRRYLEDDGEGQLAQELEQANTKPAVLKDAIAIVRRVADAAVEHKEIDILLGTTTITFDGSRLGDEQRALSVDGSLRDAMADDAANDLAHAAPWQICRCKDSGCHKVFLAARKGQLYCSHSCANAAATREYRANHAKTRTAKGERGTGKKKRAILRKIKES